MAEATSLFLVSIVIPVYRGETTLCGVVEELAPFTEPRSTPAGRRFQISEIFLVHDNGPDRSDKVILELSRRFPFVRPLWLSRNFGQHPATLAGLSSSKNEWVVTMDEDGQHDPRYIGAMLDQALDTRAQLVYGIPSNAPPHGLLRNTASRLAKMIFVLALDAENIGRFSSYRLLNGEIARSLAAHCNSNVYLDVALSWLVGRVTTLPVEMRQEGDHRSGYNFSGLVAHFWRMVLTSGTRPLRFISALGVGAILLSVALSAYALWGHFSHRVPIQGWASLFIVVSFFSGAILFSLGIVAEYLGLAVRMALGRPLYVLVSRPPGESSVQ